MEKRQIKKSQYITNDTKQRKVIKLPDYHLYDDKVKLENLLSKEANNTELTEQEYILINELR